MEYTLNNCPIFWDHLIYPSEHGFSAWFVFLFGTIFIGWMMGAMVAIFAVGLPMGLISIAWDAYTRHGKYRTALKSYVSTHFKLRRQREEWAEGVVQHVGRLVAGKDGFYVKLSDVGLSIDDIEMAFRMVVYLHRNDAEHLDILKTGFIACVPILVEDADFDRAKLDTDLLTAAASGDEAAIEAFAAYRGASDKTSTMANNLVKRSVELLVLFDSWVKTDTQEQSET
jgi:hypothetical protein